ncbi:hypothetical protein, partial [Pseudomonas syringae group genomosp. 7]|uniref:hypothetical protein n=1 Tax=Pseudomonas syringae group genomosp. 7 TaxID=251699 RepID=UPI00376FBDAC
FFFFFCCLFWFVFVGVCGWCVVGWFCFVVVVGFVVLLGWGLVVVFGGLWLVVWVGVWGGVCGFGVWCGCFLCFCVWGLVGLGLLLDWLGGVGDLRLRVCLAHTCRGEREARAA